MKRTAILFLLLLAIALCIAGQWISNVAAWFLECGADLITRAKAMDK